MILLKADNFLILNLRIWVEPCEATCVNAIIVVGRVGEALHPFGVVGPPDEALGREAVRADVDGTSKGAKDQCSHKVPQNLLPRPFSPQFLESQLSLQSAEVYPLVDCVP